MGKPLNNPTPKLQKAYEDCDTLAAAPTNDEKLDLYGLLKIADKVPFESADKPGMFDLQGKAKYGRWKKFVDEGVTDQQATDRYAELVAKLKEKYGTK
jgi:diazepam-binding inhibitor (GABA receptor modulating acyl-CoA-binding protein)